MKEDLYIQSPVSNIHAWNNKMLYDLASLIVYTPRTQCRLISYYKQTYIGNYSIERYKDHESSVTRYRLKFDTHADKIAFLLRYG